jgi:transposase
MDSYIGLDVSLREISVCMVDETGAIQLERTVAADPDAIAALVHAQASSVRRVGLESGPTSVWLWRELAQRGLPVICIDARHAKAALSMQINKSDRNDAAGIARIMQTGWYREVQVKSPHSHAIRGLLNSRSLLVKVQHRAATPRAKSIGPAAYPNAAIPCYALTCSKPLVSC